MGTNRKKSISELRESPKIFVVTRFTGTLKNKFLNDLQRGEEQSELLRKMAKYYYDNHPDNKADKHGY